MLSAAGLVSAHELLVPDSIHNLNDSRRGDKPVGKLQTVNVLVSVPGTGCDWAVHNSQVPSPEAHVSSQMIYFTSHNTKFWSDPTQSRAVVINEI